AAEREPPNEERCAARLRFAPLVEAIALPNVVEAGDVHVTILRVRVPGWGWQAVRVAGGTSGSRYSIDPGVPKRRFVGRRGVCGAVVGSASPSTCRHASQTGSFAVHPSFHATSWYVKPDQPQAVCQTLDPIASNALRPKP